MLPVVVPVKAMYECLYVRFVQVANITSSLPWLLPKHHQLWVDQSEAVNHNLCLYRIAIHSNQATMSAVYADSIMYNASARPAVIQHNAGCSTTAASTATGDHMCSSCR
jgi:hypothetical protein